jgi:alpha-N-arabinofuranosidase
MTAVSVSASRSGDVVHCSLVNVDTDNAQDLLLLADGVKVGPVKGQILTSPRVQDHNTFENPGKVKPASFKDFKMQGDGLRVKLPPCSVVVLEF